MEKLIEKITQIVCNYKGINRYILHSKIREREIVECRQISMYFAHKYIKNISLARMGNIISSQKHDAVLYAKKQVQDLMDTDPEYRHDIEEIDKKIIFNKINMRNSVENIVECIAKRMNKRFWENNSIVPNDEVLDNRISKSMEFNINNLIQC